MESVYNLLNKTGKLNTIYELHKDYCTDNSLIMKGCPQDVNFVIPRQD